MTQQDLQVIWQLSGDVAWPMAQYKLGRDRNPTLRIHAGEGTLQQARTTGAEMVILRTPKNAPNPLLALAPCDIFDAPDIFPSDGPVLVVGPKFVEEFKDELAACCQVYDLRVVLSDSMAQVGADRTALLGMARDDLDLRAVTPLRTIKTRRPTESEELYFVPASEALPPFFRVPWKVGSVFIRDDIRQRIEKKGLRGAEFNLAPWAY